MKNSKSSLLKDSLLAASNADPFEVFSLWFFGELAFNILPIAIILVVGFTFGDSTQEIFLLPDWSFASIVLCGASLNLLIELKTKIQRDDSHKIYTVTRMVTLLLIASVISLTLALLQEKGFDINRGFLTLMQITLFLISAFLPLASIANKVEYLNRYKTPADAIGASDLLGFLSFAIDEANDNLRHSVFALSKNRQSINERCQHVTIGSNFDERKQEIETLILQLETNLIHFKNEWKDITQAKSLTKNEVSENSS